VRGRDRGNVRERRAVASDAASRPGAEQMRRPCYSLRRLLRPSCLLLPCDELIGHGTVTS